MKQGNQGWVRGLAIAGLAFGGLASSACDVMVQDNGGAGNGQPDVARFETTGRCNTRTFQQGGFSFFVPNGGTGCTGPFPVVTWGNGTFTTPSSYTAFLTNIASHGFTVVASNNSNVGTGTQLVQGVGIAQQMANTGNQACSIGYSQGGGGAVNAYRNGRPTIVCAVSIAPDITITSNATATGLARILFLGGSADNVAPVGNNANVLFNQAATPKTIGVVNGATHFEALGNAGNFRGYAIAWLVAVLRPNDPDADAARQNFNGGNNCGLENDPRYGTVVCQGTL